MTMSTRKSPVLLTIFGSLAACTTGATGDETMAASSVSRSTGTVWGKVDANFLGDDCFTGMQIALVPVTDETNAKVLAVFGNDQAGSVVTRPDEVSDASRAERSLVPSARTVQCAYNRFRFGNVPAGEYFVTTTVDLAFWTTALADVRRQVPERPASIALMKRVAVAPGQSVGIILEYD